MTSNDLIIRYEGLLDALNENYEDILWYDSEFEREFQRRKVCDRRIKKSLFKETFRPSKYIADVSGGPNDLRSRNIPRPMFIKIGKKISRSYPGGPSGPLKAVSYTENGITKTSYYQTHDTSSSRTVFETAMYIDIGWTLFKKPYIYVCVHPRKLPCGGYGNGPLVSLSQRKRIKETIIKNLSSQNDLDIVVKFRDIVSH